MSKGTPADPLREALEHIIRRLEMDIDDGSRPDQWSMEDLVRKARAALATKPAETAHKHEWTTATGGQMCYQCGVMWWANNPEPDHPTESAGKSPEAADADRADARRYRWLRSPKATNDWNRLGHYGVDELDAQIDAAIAETQRSSNANGSDDEQTSPSVQPPALKTAIARQRINYHLEDLDEDAKEAERDGKAELAQEIRADIATILAVFSGRLAYSFTAPPAADYGVQPPAPEPLTAVQSMTLPMLRMLLKDIPRPSEFSNRESYVKASARYCETIVGWLAAAPSIAQPQPPAPEPFARVLYWCGPQYMFGQHEKGRTIARTFDEYPKSAEGQMYWREGELLYRATPSIAQRGAALTDEQIVEIRDEHLPSQGEPFDCIAYARAIERAALSPERPD